VREWTWWVRHWIPDLEGVRRWSGWGAQSNTSLEFSTEIFHLLSAFKLFQALFASVIAMPV
jgi:hypothetical protein